MRVVDHHGNWRPVAVGRCKIESRPVVKVTYTWEGGKGGGGGGKSARGKAQCFVQQAETVRFCLPPSSASAAAPQSKSVTEIKTGDRILVRARNRGTHLGRPIAAKVSER